jgi:putative peptidoglycan lipid II flippase
VGNILSVVISAVFLRRMLGHLDGARIANSYIRMGYAALGSAIAGAGALWLLGSYNPDGFAWSGRLQALVTLAVVGPVMLAVYFLLLRVFRVSELSDMLRPLLGRLGRGSQAPVHEAGNAPSDAPSDGSAPDRRNEPERATTSVDTGLIPRISGEFDAVSFRAGPDPQRGSRRPDADDDGTGPSAEASYLPGEDQPSTARGGLLSEQIPLPGRRTYQGKAGENPFFSNRRKGRK